MLPIELGLLLQLRRQDTHAARVNDGLVALFDLAQQYVAVWVIDVESEQMALFNGFFDPLHRGKPRRIIERARHSQ